MGMWGDGSLDRAVVSVLSVRSGWRSYVWFVQSATTPMLVVTPVVTLLAAAAV